MQVAIGSDHRGFELKNTIIDFFRRENIAYRDYGCHNTDSVDYPDIALEVGRAVASGNFQRGVLICGTGIGMCMAANKIKGIINKNSTISQHYYTMLCQVGFSSRNTSNIFMIPSYSISAIF